MRTHSRKGHAWGGCTDNGSMPIDVWTTRERGTQPLSLLVGAHTLVAHKQPTCPPLARRPNRRLHALRQGSVTGRLRDLCVRGVPPGLHVCGGRLPPVPPRQLLSREGRGQVHDLPWPHDDPPAGKRVLGGLRRCSRWAINQWYLLSANGRTTCIGYPLQKTRCTRLAARHAGRRFPS